MLLVDADERARGLTFLSGLLDSFGVSDLNSPVDVDRAIHQWDMADGFRLDFAPAGPEVLGIVLIVTEGTRSRDLEEARH